MRHNASKTHRRRPKTPPRPIQDASKKKLQPSWGRLKAYSGVLGRLGAVLGAFWGRLGSVFLAPWGHLFFGVDFGVILDAILGSILGPIFDHFGVMKMMMMMMFMSDVTKPEMANRILRAAALAEGLYNIPGKLLFLRLSA